jgi:hypothetical protein
LLQDDAARRARYHNFKAMRVFHELKNFLGCTPPIAVGSHNFKTSILSFLNDVDF